LPTNPCFSLRNPKSFSLTLSPSVSRRSSGSESPYVGRFRCASTGLPTLSLHDFAVKEILSSRHFQRNNVYPSRLSFLLFRHFNLVPRRRQISVDFVSNRSVPKSVLRQQLRQPSSRLTRDQRDQPGLSFFDEPAVPSVRNPSLPLAQLFSSGRKFAVQLSEWVSWCVTPVRAPRPTLGRPFF